jgi:ribosome-binding factor A
MRANRIERVNEFILKEVSQMFLREIKDPRIGFITVTGVQTSLDLSHAKIFVSIMGEDEEKDKAMEGLSSAAGYIRMQLKKRMSIKKIPDLHFLIDDSAEHGALIEKTLKRLKELEGWGDE